MSDKLFEDPRLAINRVYTRRGDAGDTALAGGQRIAKDDIRIKAYGTVDELNSFVGAARVTASALAAEQTAIGQLGAILLRVQHELFNLGSILATLPGDVHPRQARITEAEVRQLEAEIDRMNSELRPLRSFVLAGSSRLNADLDICRTVCRRAERTCVSLTRRVKDTESAILQDAVRYLNRLSDALFVWSRWVSHVTGTPETLWEPNRAASGQREES
ncbi:MAG TPA: cob(I)yrinic acid a,c-diamide adenosyltransferase [Bryobacteraceae bacterium]|jgi:cob(I)alamin adenosyltransferase